MGEILPDVGDSIMLYVENLRQVYQIRETAEQVTLVNVEDIRYVINATGKIAISMRTNNSVYEKFVFTCGQKRKTKLEIIDTAMIHPGDEFEIWFKEDSLYIYEFWLLNKRSSSTRGISTTEEPSHCPVCDSRLLFEEDGYYCVNSVCPAQIKMTLRKFLFFTSNGQFVYTDFKIIDLMITQTIVRSPIDLFTITPNDLVSLGCRQDVAEEIHKSIHDLLGNVTISAYLKSLNLNISEFSIFNPGEPNRIVLNDQLIDESFHSIAEFLDWWKFVISTPGQSPEPYMNETTFIAINNYLNHPENLKIIYQLDSFGLFKYL